MLTSPLTGNVQTLLNSLMSNVDANRDGVVSTDEFGAFLTTLLQTTELAGEPAPGSPGSPGTPGTPGSPSAPGTTGTQPLQPTIGRPGISFEGFDLARAQDPQRSAKDAFASLASSVGTTPQTKTEAAEWFNQYIRADMESLGHTIDWVTGDKFQFTNWQGTYVIDFVRGADGPSPALSWIVDSTTGVPGMTGGTPGTPPPIAPGTPVQEAFEALAAASNEVPQTKQEAESWFNRYIRAGLESIGVNINWVIGDKFEYAGATGPVVVDFIVGADGPNPSLGWLVE